MTREYETSSWYIKFDDFYYFYLILIMVYLILIMAIYECTRAAYKKYEIWIKLRYKIWWFGFHITTVIFVIWHKIQTAWHFYWPKSVLKHMLSGVKYYVNYRSDPCEFIESNKTAKSTITHHASWPWSIGTDISTHCRPTHAWTCVLKIVTERVEVDVSTRNWLSYRIG